MIQAGTYIATAVAAEIGAAKTGTEFVAINFKVPDGSTIWGFLFLSENAFERTVNTLAKVFGFDSNFETIEGQVKNKQCEIIIEDDEYEGKTRQRVKWINVVGSAPASPVAQRVELNRISLLTAKARRILGPSAIARKPAAAQGSIGEDAPF